MLTKGRRQRFYKYFTGSNNLPSISHRAREDLVVSGNTNAASMNFSAELMKLFCDREIFESHGQTAPGELATRGLLREVAFLLDRSPG